MARRNTKKFTSEQRRELQELLTTTSNVKVYRRTHALLSLDEGDSAAQIQSHTGYSERAQFFWLRRYREEGIAGLKDQARSGRPRTRPIPSPRLDTWARITLEQMHTNHPKPYLRARAQMVLLWAKDYSIPTIADIVGVEPQTVRTVLAAYAQDKLVGLYRHPGSGRASRLGAERWAQVKEWLHTGPTALGYRFVIWTTRSLRWYVYHRFSVWLSRERIRQVLHHLFHFSWTRAKKVWAYADDPDWQVERQRFCQQMLVLLEHARKGECILLFLDETILTLAGKLGYSWSPRGDTPEVPSTGKKDRIVVFGAVDPITGRPHRRVEERPINQASTLDFLKQLVRYYTKHAPGIPLVIVLDKHAGHTAGVVEASINQFDHVRLVNTPTQSPDLNPIEHLWDWLTERMIKNAFFEVNADLKHAVRHFFCYIAGVKEQVLSWLGDLQKLYTVGAEI